MSKNPTLVLVLGFIAGGGAACVAPLIIPPAHAQTTQRWEVHCEHYSDRQPGDTAAWFTRAGTAFGREGWEPFTAAASPRAGNMIMCFKRSVP